MLGEFDSPTARYEGGVTTNKTLEDKNQEHLATIWRLKHQLERKQYVIDQLKQEAARHAKIIQEQQAKNHEHHVKIMKLKKMVAQMNVFTKVKLDIHTLKIKRLVTEQILQQGIRAIKAERTKADEELEELEERERELEMDN
jgi:hypothetical protein